MRKFLIISLVMLMSFSTKGCSNTNTEETESTSEGNLPLKNNYEIKSPNGQLVVNINIGEQLTYNLSVGGAKLMNPSPISMKVGTNSNWGKNSTLKAAYGSNIDKSINAPFYQKKTVTDSYYELILDFGAEFDLAFRAYDEGMAYRFISKRKDSYHVYAEQADFAFADDYKAYVGYANTPNGSDKFQTSFESMYTQTTLSSIQGNTLIMTPLLASSGSKKICIAESNVIDYPGMFLVRTTSKGNILNGRYAPYPSSLFPIAYSNYIATCKGERNFPWRIVSVAGSDADMLTNDMIYRLAPKLKINDTSWIKPGLSAWDYWSYWGYYNKGVSDNQKTVEIYKQFIDLAAKYNLPYYTIDSGWANGSMRTPRINLQELIDYANTKNVGLILWGYYSDFIEGQNIEDICRKYSAMGIKGFKIDFWDHDNQRYMDLMYKAAETTAKYKLMIIFHGSPKPTGLERAFPNVVSYEGIYGLEYAGEYYYPNMGAKMLEDLVTFPFIRGLAGPTDYTPGAMSNFGTKTQQNFQSPGTRSQQLASFISIFSPVGSLCDSPEAYEKNEGNKACIDFISKIPTVWDETIVIDAKIGEYIVLARNKGNEWFISGINNKTEYRVNLNLSFLTSGTYQMNLISDADDAAENPEHFKNEQRTVTNSSTLTLKMIPGGGFAARIFK